MQIGTMDVLLAQPWQCRARESSLQSPATFCQHGINGRDPDDVVDEVALETDRSFRNLQKQVVATDFADLAGNLVAIFEPDFIPMDPDRPEDAKAEYSQSEGENEALCLCRGTSLSFPGAVDEGTHHE